ncbi:kinase-like protein [Aaosphaeria arxii CBS 175.79]|uniref:Kinase-like protein n=1 Tax=Aaosphaeria arxii CBS 175.79 TaxID=1450172 RepID=A0A6A5X9A7_9PLEO|nr:kinase-like protein [Aaosphaeria arxii CBS 175.79]KAF2009542.1 kinase-like protein [Aaosphaeria arxii CBS 175.79]
MSNWNSNIKPRLHDTPQLRLPVDHIPEKNVLVFKYMTNDLLSLVHKAIPVKATKQILKATLKGIVQLHEADVLHLDVKPGNVLIDYQESEDGIVVSDVALTDLETAVYIPPGKALRGAVRGNENWRSPEMHFRAEVYKPADMYAFGAVCVYAMLNKVLFGLDNDFQHHVRKGAEPDPIRLQRQVSYFGTQEELDGLMTILRDDDERSCTVLSMLWEDRYAEYHAYRPFDEWPEVTDEVFKDLMRELMTLSPLKRMSAHQAVRHPWFADV